MSEINDILNSNYDTSDINKIVSKYKVSLREAVLLKLLNDNSELTINKICSKLKRHRSTISCALNKLKRRKLVIDKKSSRNKLNRAGRLKSVWSFTGDISE